METRLQIEKSRNVFGQIFFFFSWGKNLAWHCVWEQSIQGLSYLLCIKRFLLQTIGTCSASHLVNFGRYHLLRNQQRCLACNRKPNQTKETTFSWNVSVGSGRWKYFSSKLEIGKECSIGIGHKPEMGVCVYFMYVYLLDEMRKNSP